MCFGAMIVSVWILACVMATGIGIARIVLPGQSWQADMMSFIATESSPQGAIQFELGRLRMYADTYKQGQNEDIQDCSQILEAQGITVAVSQDGRLGVCYIRQRPIADRRRGRKKLVLAAKRKRYGKTGYGYGGHVVERQYLSLSIYIT